MPRRTASIALALALAAGLPARGGGLLPIDCSGVASSNYRPATGVPDPAGEIRVFAIQFKQLVDRVETYESFRRAVDCLTIDLTRARDLDRDGKLDKPTIVVFDEDIGLATLATGTRGAPARAIASHGPKDPSSIPGALSAFASLGATYQPAVSYYAANYPDTSPQRLILAAATDVFARGFMQTFSDLARDFGVYVVASNNQAEFRVSANPAAIAALADPDLVAEYASGRLTSVYEAVDVPGETGRGRAGIDVFNQAWMWAPTEGVTDYAHDRFDAINGAPIKPDDPRANVIAVNRKTPLTNIEQELLDLSDDGDMSDANTGPFCLLPRDDHHCRIKIGYGISLPAFQWGSEFGAPFEGNPCASSATWMRCLDARGVNLFLQPEANSGMWAEYIDCGWKPCAWQALSWLDSAWRAVADPTVHNIRYAVTPHMVGNLVDLTFDGQSVIFERCLPREHGDTCDGNTATNFAGAKLFSPCSESRTSRCDDELLRPYSGYQRHFLAVAPWVMEECPLCLSPIDQRELLAARARAMQAGTGSPEENGYLETAIWADLDFD